MPEYFKSTSSKPADTKVEKYKSGGTVAPKVEKYKGGGTVAPKTVARGSGAARTQYFRKNG
mgnify:CR=1 FL=1